MSWRSGNGCIWCHPLLCAQQSWHVRACHLKISIDLLEEGEVKKIIMIIIKQGKKQVSIKLLIDNVVNKIQWFSNIASVMI